MQSWLALSAATLFSRRKLASIRIDTVCSPMIGIAPRNTPRHPEAASLAGELFSARRILTAYNGDRKEIFSASSSSSVIFRCGHGTMDLIVSRVFRRLSRMLSYRM